MSDSLWCHLCDAEKEHAEFRCETCGETVCSRHHFMRTGECVRCAREKGLL